MTDDIQYGKLIYKRGDRVEIYRGKIISTNQVVCIKVLYCDNLQGANETLQESYNMMRFRDLPNIVKIYQSDLSQVSNRFFVRVVMEYFSKGDLYNLIKSRQPDNYWTENELLGYLIQLVEVFSVLEDKNIAHRDIKPDNIFVSENLTLVVGDLGSAKEKTIPQSATISGTPMYLSPEIRRAYMDYIAGQVVDNFSHNPFKSDIYSLGLTFLYMASLKDCSDLFRIDLLERSTEQRILELNKYPFFMKILEKMLAFDPANRCNFKELLNILKPKIIEINPQAPISEVCFSCYRSAKKFMKVFEKLVCLNCIENCTEHFWDSEYKCWKCGNEINKGICKSCGEKLCPICKRKAHLQSCFEASGSQEIADDLYCLKCDGFCVGEDLKVPKSYWRFCKKNSRDDPYCVVCCKGLGDPHSLCSLLYQDESGFNIFRRSREMMLLGKDDKNNV